MRQSSSTREKLVGGGAFWVGLSIFDEKKNFLQEDIENIEITAKEVNICERFVMEKLISSYIKNNHCYYVYVAKKRETFLWEFNYMSQKKNI